MSAALPHDARPTRRSEPVYAGRVIGGKYRLEEPLGSGGNGVVWRATHLGLDAPVAVKLLRTRERPSDKAIDTFLHEARAAAAVRHWNIVAITDFGSEPDEDPYMVMELLDGITLRDALERRKRLPVAEVAALAAQCLSGLAAVHDAGLVHRDVKPENVFLVDDGGVGHAKLIDFGISRALHAATLPEMTDSGRRRRGAMLTADGSRMGTPYYASPEQVRGLSDVDASTDLYSLGVVLYEALAGHVPYDAPNVVDLMIEIVRGDAPPLVEVRPGVGDALSAVVARAMAPREWRYADAREMRAALLLAAAQVPAEMPGATDEPRDAAPEVGVVAPAAPRALRDDATGRWTLARNAAIFVTALCLVAMAVLVGVRAARPPRAAGARAPVSSPPPPPVVRIAARPPEPVAHTAGAPVLVDAPPRLAAPPPPARTHRTTHTPHHATSAGDVPPVDGLARDPGF